MRSRLVIPAALLVTAVYVMGRLDASARRQDLRLPPVPPPVDPVLRAEAEAADALIFAEADAAGALIFAEAQTAATATLARPVHRDTLHPSVLSEWSITPAPAAPRRPREHDASDVAALAEWAAHVAPAAAPDPVVEVEIDESGCFSLGGWAAQAGHMALCGVTFRDRRGEAVDAAAIRLRAEATTNVTDGGLVVLSDPGFAPDVEGFTILLAASAPGSFAAAGRYEVAAA